MPTIELQELVLLVPALALIIFYHWFLYRRVRKSPMKTAIGVTNHARMMWVNEVRKNKRDVLAIQTLRNQVMAATFLASTAIIISLGSFNAAFRPGTFIEVSHTLNLFGTKTESLWMFKLMSLGILFFYSFFNFTLALRYYTHSSFMINIYDQDDATTSAASVTGILNHGALHHTIGMRGFYLSIPLALWLFGPIWMLSGSVIMVAILYHLDGEA